MDASHPLSLPSAGFEQGKVAKSETPFIHYASLANDEGGMTLTIPSLDISTSISGVPRNGLGWDVNWLGDGIGYLYGTTFPTWDGNSVLVGHKVNALGQKSIFSDLANLSYGDQVIIKAWGQQYIYEVYDVYWVDAENLDVLADSDLNMLTLITCDGFNTASSVYDQRVVVRAYLVSVR